MNLFFNFFISNIFVSFIVVLLFLFLSPSYFLGGFYGMITVALLSSFTFSSLLPSWFSLSAYGILYWVIYYSVPAIGSTLGLIFLAKISKQRNDL